MKKKRKFTDESLPISERVDRLIALLTIDEKIGLLPTAQSAIPRLGINKWYIGGEVARGYVTHEENEFATVFPQPIGMASMFDTELMEKIGEIAADELRYYNANNHPYGHLFLWGPTVDMCRDPRWGRTEECYGEDPFLTGCVSTAYTKGLSGKGTHRMTSPSLKHFFANNNENDRVTDSSNIEPRTKHEYYYAAFKPSIKAGYALGVMTSYNSINGRPAMVNSDINTICKKKWGMRYAVTDGGDFVQTTNAHKYTENHAQTIALAIKNGTDIMCDEKEIVISAGKEAFDTGLISEKDIDKAIYNSLYVRFQLGEFDESARSEFSEKASIVVNNDEFRQVNLQAAREAITLLKNNSLLPFDEKKVKTVAVLGINGCENMRDWYTGTSSYQVTIADGFKKLLGEENVICDRCEDEVAYKSKLTGKYLYVDEDGLVRTDGESAEQAAVFIKSDYDSEIVLKSKCNDKFLTDENGKITASGTSLFSWFTRQVIRPEKVDKYYRFRSLDNDDIYADDGFLRVKSLLRIDDSMLFEEEIINSGVQKAAELAAKADCAIVCAGNNPMLVARECYDRKNLELPSFQKRLVKSALAANKKTVLLIVSSYPYAICDENKKVPAVLYTAHGGPEMGNAVADVIFGRYNPAGRTPLTWYSSADELPSIKDYDIISNDSTYLYYNRKPLYPFGYGLSYSSFAYSGLYIVEHKNSVTVEFDVENTSEKDGDEVVQLYYTAVNPSVKRPLRQLCGFKRLFIKSGTSVHVEIEVTKETLSFWDVSRNKFVFESGKYCFFTGGSSADDKCTLTVELSGENIPPRNIKKRTLAINYDAKDKIKIAFSDSEQKEYVESGDKTDGVIIFKNCDCSEISEFIVKVSTLSPRTRVSVHADDEPLSEITLPQSVYPDKFSTFTLKFDKMKKNDVKDIRINLSPNVRMLSFKAK